MLKKLKNVQKVKNSLKMLERIKNVEKGQKKKWNGLKILQKLKYVENRYIHWWNECWDIMFINMKPVILFLALSVFILLPYH